MASLPHAAKKIASPDRKQIRNFRHSLAKYPTCAITQNRTMVAESSERGELPMSELVSYRMFIDGAWVEAEDGKTFQSLNPATEEAWAEGQGGPSRLLGGTLGDRHTDRAGPLSAQAG
jgi:hypothetical protein